MAAKTFPTAKIRNVALVGHGGAGKTSLAEALLFVAGRHPPPGPGRGRQHRHATSTPRSTSARISVSLALAPFEHEGHKINVLDTPGYADFVGDVAAALHAADLAVFVVSAVEGVEVQTEVGVAHGRRARPPARGLRQQARPRARVVRSARSTSSRTSSAPASRRSSSRSARRPTSTAWSSCSTTTRSHYDRRQRRPTGADPAPRWRARSTRCTTRSIEGIVVADDDLMERYLADETIAIDELARRARRGHRRGQRCSRCCAAARRSSIGIDRLAHFIAEEGPAPTAAGDGPPVAFVFKTIVDPYVGHVNLFKVLQGTVKTDATLVNGRTDRRRAPAPALRRCGARSRTP